MLELICSAELSSAIPYMIGFMLGFLATLIGYVQGLIHGKLRGSIYSKIHGATVVGVVLNEGATAVAGAGDYWFWTGENDGMFQVVKWESGEYLGEFTLDELIKLLPSQAFVSHGITTK